jgi:LysR family nitrogen assimilation transcriptional regulator
MRKLGALPIALPSTAHGLRRIIERAAAAAGINLQVKTEIDPSEQLKQMVRKTGCFTILSLAALQDEARTPLAIARIVDPPIQRVISILHVTGRPLSRAARRVENVLLEIISEEVKKGWWRPARSSGLDKRQTDNDLTNI